MVVVAAMAWHAVGVGHAWRQAARDHTGKDFASYYYAVKATKAGANPNNRSELRAAVSEDGARAGVHPFFYPPPFLAATSWLGSYTLVEGYRLWFWLDELCALMSLLVLTLWWRPLGPAVPAVLAATLALMPAVPNNHLMGQANFFVLFLVVTALWDSEVGQHRRAGVLMGFACMLKMSPALFVAWWVLRGKTRSVLPSVGTALAVSAVSLFWVDASVQADFYTRVLPTFGNGGYNGLGVGIDLFGNHSIPNLLDEAFPSSGRVLSDKAVTGSRVAALGLVAWTGLVLRRSPIDRVVTWPSSYCRSSVSA